MKRAAGDWVRFGRHPGVPPHHPEGGGVASVESAPYPFAYARTALKYGLEALGFGQGDAVLVPEFICDVVLEPLRALGVEPRYYPSGPGLEPDWPAVERLFTPTTKGCLVVHYFGQPQDLHACAAFCREHALVLIEDNAHGYGAEFEGQRLGSTGEIGISAPRKSFPIRNGAFLHMRPGLGIDGPRLRATPVARSSTRREFARTLEKWPLVEPLAKGFRRWQEMRRRSSPPPAYDSQDAFREPPLRHSYGMDPAAYQWLQQQDLEHVRTIRLSLYRAWERWALARGLRPLFDELAPGAMPLVFPALVDSQQESRAWFLRGHRLGVDVHSWPTLPREIVANAGLALNTWERLVCFPIHQGMDEELLQRRLESL